MLKHNLLSKNASGMIRGPLPVLLVLVSWTSGASADEAQESFDLARRTLTLVERSAPRPHLTARLAALGQQMTETPNSETTARETLAEKGRRLRREIIFSHPLLDFDTLLINKRPPPAYLHQSRQYLGRYSQPGPGLVVLRSWKTDPRETPLIEGRLPAGSVLHPDLSFDGRRVLFAFCDHRRAKPDLRRFSIYEIGVDGSRLRRLTGTSGDSMTGADGRRTALVEDLDPCYLPDGGFAFVSTRLQTHVRCQYGGRYFANFVLYRAESDGSKIRRISFGEAPEWEPSLLHDGRLVYTRWDYVNRHDTFFQSLWVTRPDGAATAHVYGNYTRNPCTTGEPRAVPGSHKIVTTAVAHHSYTAGSIILVDPHKGQDGPAPIERITPEIEFPETEGWPLGAYATPYPLSEDLFLVAYTPDQLMREGKQQRHNAYGIYLLDTLGGRELIYRDPEMSSFSPIPVKPRPAPPVLPDVLRSPVDEENEKTGVFYVENVYRSTQSIRPGSVKQLRVLRLYPQTIETPPSRGKAIIDMPKRIEGTVAVEKDGSVAFRAVAERPLTFQLLDENGMALMSMRTLVYLQPGEVAGCVGCHEPRAAATRRVAMPAGVTIQQLKPPAGPRHEGGLSFARTVQPVLDRYCIDCHGLDGTEGDLDLLGTLEDVTFAYPVWPGPNRMIVSHAYWSLMNHPTAVAIAQRNFETDFSVPEDYFAHAGSLADMLLDGHEDDRGKPRIELDGDSFARIVDWLDTNAMFYGDYSWNKPQWRGTLPAGEKALRQHLGRTLGPEMADQPFAALVNLAEPLESRALLMPLATSAGGWNRAGDAWADRNHPGYKKMLQLVMSSIAGLEFHDVAGTCAQDECLCDTCWVRLAGEDRER